MTTIEVPKTKFTPTLARPHPFYEGSQLEYTFPNGRGASVIRHKNSYGSKSGLWELAVLDNHGNLDYSTPVTGDVLGHLDDEEVESLLTQISELETTK